MKKIPFKNPFFLVEERTISKIRTVTKQKCSSYRIRTIYLIFIYQKEKDKGEKGFPYLTMTPPKPHNLFPVVMT